MAEERVLRRARALWGAGATEGASAYLHLKGVQGLGVRYQVADHAFRAWTREDGREIGPQRVPAGSVLIPMRQIGERLIAVQWIAPDGTKQFLGGAPTVGAVHLIPGSGDGLLIGEGYATVAAVSGVLGWRALVAFSTGGLEPAGLAAVMRWPRARLAWLADWDGGADGKEGVAAAQRAANRCGGVVLVPPHVEGAEDSPKIDWADVAAGLTPDELRQVLRESYARGLAERSRADRSGPAARILHSLGVLDAQ
jgi:phage/plasmid primase-like uncharacterized protein